MSLAGNLEDLELGDIIQIISMSRKSGILLLRKMGGEGQVVFRDGQVVYARSGSVQRFFGEILIERGLLDEAALQRALAVQKQGRERERLGTILVKSFRMNPDHVETVAREQIRHAMHELFTWRNGTFEFDLRDDVEAVDDASVDPVQFMLENGLNPQLLMTDENDQEGAEPERTSSGHVPAPPVPVKSSSEENGRLVILVDDDEVILELLTQFLTDNGWEVTPFTKAEDALVALEKACRSKSRPTVVVDMIMPRMDGSGILGGLELLELIHGNFDNVPIVAMSDYHNLEAERKVRNYGFSFVLKPRRAEMSDSRNFRSFSRNVLKEIESRHEDEVPLCTGEKINFGADLLGEMGEEPGIQITPAVSSRGISLLRSMLAELNNPGLGGGIILLVLRFASEFMSRAIIFSVKENLIIGLGQFGISKGKGNPDSMIRDLRIPCDEPSMFSDVMNSGLPVKLKPDDCKWNRYLFNHIGGMPEEVFLGPLLNEGNVVAILYGDALPEGRAVGDTDSLEIFLSQAGIAMDKTLLERRLREFSAEGM